MTGTKSMARRAKKRGPIVVRSIAILIVVAWSGVCAADVLNPSFETTYAGLPMPRPLPTYWSRIDNASFNSYCTNVWYTEGNRGVGMFNRIGKSVSRGSSQGFYQFVDLTGMGSIEFDVRLMALPQGAGPFAHFEASFRVDGVVLWSRNVDGVYLDQKVDVSNLAGWRRIEFRNTAVDAGTFGAAYWTLWDNMRLIEKPKIIPAVISLDPPILNPRSNGNWITCYIELKEGKDVNEIDGGSVTLNGIPAYMGQQDWAKREANAENVADFDGDGIRERMVRFDRGAVAATIGPPQGTVTVQGRLADGTVGTGLLSMPKPMIPFEGAATLGVLTQGGASKK